MSAAASASASQPARHTEIDVLKAVAIVTVVWIHASVPWPLPHIPFLWDMMTLTRFAVPTFFLTAGFLYFSPSPISRAVVARRLRRIVIPYAIASAIAITGRWLLVGPIPPRQAVYELLTGSAVGVYYFVPVLAAAVLLLPLLSRRPRSAVPLLAVFFVGGLLSEVFFPGVHVSPERDPFFWEFRSPFRWWGYFLAGWVLARYYPQVRGVSRPLARTIGIGALLLLVALFAYYAAALPPRYTPVGGVVHYAAIYCTISSVFFLALGTPARPGVRWLSDATYPLYLYHPFFISWWQDVLARYFPHVSLVPDPIAFLVGILGSMGVVVAGRRLLGRHARQLLG